MNYEENDLINIMSLKDIMTTNDNNNIYYLLSFINLLGQWDFYELARTYHYQHAVCYTMQLTVEQ